MEENLNIVNNSFQNNEEIDLNKLPILSIAYVGDALFSLFIRTYVIKDNGSTIPEALSKNEKKYVSAVAQSKMIRLLIENNFLDDDEIYIFKRGRNAHSKHKAKNASISDYKRSSGFEALLGFHYLSGNMNRCIELIKKGIQLLKESDEE